MRQSCNASRTRCDYGSAKQYRHQGSLKHPFAMTHGEEPRDPVRKEKTGSQRKQVRRIQPHDVPDLRTSESDGVHQLRAEEILRMPNGSKAPGGKRRQKDREVVDRFRSRLPLGWRPGFCLNRLGQACPVASRALRPTRTVAQPQIRSSIDSCRRCMPGIDADGGWLLVFRACDQSTAGISLVNFTQAECGEKQNEGKSDKAEHEPNEE